MRSLRLALGSLALLAALFAPVARAQPVRFAVLPRLSAAELTTMFKPLADHLQTKLGRPVELVIPKDFDAFEALVSSGGAELAFANPYVYVKARRKADVVPLAIASEKKGGDRFRGVLVVRKDSGITSLEALRGKTLIFVDEDSLGGYLAQALLLQKAGIDTRKDVTQLPFAKKHDTVVMAVFGRAAAAGGIREDDLDKMQGKVDLSQLEVLARSEAFPNWPLFATPGLDAAGREAVRAALLELAEGAPALEAAKLRKFTSVADKDYDVVRAAAKSVGAFYRRGGSTRARGPARAGPSTAPPARGDQAQDEPRTGLAPRAQAAPSRGAPGHGRGSARSHVPAPRVRGPRPIVGDHIIPRARDDRRGCSPSGNTGPAVARRPFPPPGRCTAVRRCAPMRTWT